METVTLLPVNKSLFPGVAEYLEKSVIPWLLKTGSSIAKLPLFKM